MADIKAIFFDFDETLVGTHACTETAYKRIRDAVTNSDVKEQFSLKSSVQWDIAIEIYKKELESTPNATYKTKSPQEIRTELWENAILQSLQPDAKLSFSRADVLKLATELYEIWVEERLKNLKMMEPNTKDVLRSLRKKYNLVLITNGSSAVQWKKIKETDIQKLFDHVLVSGDEEHDKPHVSIFQKACSLCGLEPEECIMVGDTLGTDILGANMSGLGGSILYEPSGKLLSEQVNDPTEHMRPTKTISSISQLSSAIALL